MSIPATVKGMPEEEWSDEDKLACREHPGVWFDSCAWVQDREKQLRKADPANNIQTELFKIYCWCQDNQQPCNIIGLKSRKEGLSTGATALAYHHLSEHRAEGVFIGTDYEISDTLTRMLRTYAENDAFPWGTKLAWTESDNSGKWSHGSELKRLTAMDSKAARSKTLQVLVATEIAHWPSDGIRNADETMLSLLNSMPDIWNILRVLDSTAAGMSGFFYDTYSGAVTFAERKAGKRGNGWIRLFEPWHASPLRRVTLTDPQRAEVMLMLSEREKQGVAAYAWDSEQIQWRRNTIAEKCKGDEKKFDQEYPESEEVAFLTSGSPALNGVQVGRMHKRAKDMWEGMVRGQVNCGRLGHLVESGSGIHFMADPSNAWLWLLEPPVHGRSYNLPTDPMTGAQSSGAKVRDCHASGILRAPYADGGQVFKAELACALYDPEGCRWDMDVLADRMALLHRWYGNCLVVPEVNKAMDLIPLLRARGVSNIYNRPTRPDAENPSERSSAVGFYSSEQTRRVWVSALIEAVREGDIGCAFPTAIADLLTFIINKGGRAEAAPNKHDDWCSMLGIGLVTLPLATVLPFPAAVPPNPWQVPGYQGSMKPGTFVTQTNPFGACG